jgi:predicted enzyme related to lactoylglutathione lyase
MTIDNVFASVAVKNLKAAARWYEGIFGRPADSNPIPEVLEWKFRQGGWLQVYELPERAGSGSFTLAVSDLDAEVKKLLSLGIDSGQRWSSKIVETVMITDPDGNHIAFAETRRG